jgi:stearoyl-CoA desaturase (delta-9 desaturase)
LRALLRRARALLTRDDALIDAEGRERLHTVLARSQSLAVVYQYRVRLQEIWRRSALNHRERLEALQEWCAQAEATGIQVLERFAVRLRGYTQIAA